MRIVRGFEAARDALCNNRGLNLADVPAHVQAKTEEVFGERLTPAQAVEVIVDRVRRKGDEAILDLTRRIDGVDPEDIEVPRSAVAKAYDELPDEVVGALTLAAGRIRAFHEASMAKGWIDFSEGYGQILNAVQRVGAYVPGGTARYPSTVLMTAIPARVAGVDEIIVCSPSPGSCLPDPATLVAADIAGVDRVFRIGGAQAVAAMAYGTETVPRVDMICGPGNVFVTLAKKLVYGDVGIDGLYGPTETLIVADETANPTLCAVDLLAQAEHDALARPVLITTSEHLALAVDKETQGRVERLDRGDVARAAMEGQGCIVVVANLDEALDLANRFAPEHLSLMVRDYVAGPSHVMPTGGTARFSSGLGVHSFLKISPIIALSDGVSAGLARDAAVIARAEGFTAHAEAAEIRQELL